VGVTDSGPHPIIWMCIEKISLSIFPIVFLLYAPLPFPNFHHDLVNYFSAEKYQEIRIGFFAALT
jgi:hypothetical protein